MSSIEENLNPHENFNVESLSKSLRFFGAVDYAVFVAMLLCSSLVGLYFGYKDHKMQKNNKRLGMTTNADEYLVGGRRMKVLPIALSLVASYASGITLLGTSTEIYLYGTQYCYFLLAIVSSAFVIHYVAIPVFYGLEITSLNEYLEARFDRKMRIFGSISSIIGTSLYLPIVIYVPALAFNQLTGINIHVITPISMSICIFYTSMGGIKAVIWTDVLQITLMYGTLLLIAVKGTINVGGFSTLIQRNLDGKRFEAPDVRLDPTIRQTFWSLLIGGFTFWTSVNGITQSSVQRFLSLKNLKQSRQSHFYFTIGVIILIAICMYNGLLLFAKYYNCDPLTTKLANAKDQLLPLLAMETLKDYPGLSGLFVSGIFSAALSSASTVLNSMAAIVLYDFFDTFREKKLSKRGTDLVMRGTVIVSGIISVLLVYVVENLGAIMQLAMSVPGAVGGPVLGVFTIGVAMPWIGGRATWYATLTSCSITLCIIFKAQWEIMKGRFNFATKPTTVDGCFYNFTASIGSDENDVNYEHNQVYHMSYLYYTTFGMLLVIVIAFLFSFHFGFQDAKKVDQRLIAPFLRKYIEFNKVEVREETEMEVLKQCKI